MSRGPWDGVVPGGRIHRPRVRRGIAGGVGEQAAATSGTRPSAAVARVRRVTPGRRGAIGLAGLALALAAFLPTDASAGTVEPSAAPVVRTHGNAAATLDGRVKLLSAELQLTPEQQLKVRALLLQQREQVRELWSAPNVAPALRIGRTQGISDRTAESIRGLLDESQRRKYIQPRQREAAVGAPGADVQAWMATEAGQ